MIRTVLTILAICVYTLLFNLYIYELFHTDWDEHYTKLLWCYLTLGMLLFYVWDKSDKFSGFFHEQFNKVCIWLVIANTAIITLHKHGIDGEAKLTWTFNLSVFITTAVFLFCGIRNRTFKYY